MTDHVISLDDETCLRPAVAGGKGASLGAMRSEGMPVPPGFVVTALALTDSLTAHGALNEVTRLVGSLETGADAGVVAAELQRIVQGSPPPMQLSEEIEGAYRGLGANVPVAVRSSACAEDSEQASFAGQQETFLNVIGPESVLDRVVDCWASFFSERALFYRQKKGSLSDLGMAVVVQCQIGSDKSGVIFTADPIRRRSDQIVIEAVLGLGEAVVSGLVTPDNYVVRKTGAIKRAHVGRQSQMIVRADDGGTTVLDLDDEAANTQVLDEVEIARLLEVGLQLERAFGAPQDIEWAFEDGELYVLQSRPITA